MTWAHLRDHLLAVDDFGADVLDDRVQRDGGELGLIRRKAHDAHGLGEQRAQFVAHSVVRGQGHAVQKEAAQLHVGVPLVQVALAQRNVLRVINKVTF